MLVKRKEGQTTPCDHSAESGLRTRRLQSRPSNNASNCARERRITRSCSAGPAKRLCSRRFHASTRPVASHHRTYTRSMRLGRNITATPEYGSRPSSCSTTPTRAPDRQVLYGNPPDVWPPPPPPHRCSRGDHRSPRNADATSAIRQPPISPSRRTVTPRALIETDAIEAGPLALSTAFEVARQRSDMEDAIEAGPLALSTSSVANAGCGSGSTTTGSADDGTASLPWRARLRHDDNCQRDSP